jgi:hypothetical protein
MEKITGGDGMKWGGQEDEYRPPQLFGRWSTLAYALGWSLLFVLMAINWEAM